MVAVTRRALGLATLAGAGLAAVPRTFAQPTKTLAERLGPTPGLARLIANENPLGPSPAALAAIAETASLGAYYPTKAVGELAAMIAERHGLSPKQVVISTGSTEVLDAICLAWSRRGRIVSPALTFDPPVRYAENLGGQIERVAMTANLDCDLSAMAEAARQPGVSLVHFCNPNNPTGIATEPAALTRFAQAVTPHATLLVDEAYAELAPPNPAARGPIDMVRDGENVIVTRTFSKIYAMAGLRVGYALASEENAAAIRPLLMNASGTMTGLAAAIASYEDADFVDYSRAMVAEARGRIERAASAAGVRALPSAANFVYLETGDADRFRDAMAERRILVRGAYEGWPAWSRVSTGLLDDVDRFAAALPEVMAILRG